MQSDNVTPFRPRKPPPKPSGGLGLKSPRGKAVMVQGLTLLTFVLNFVLTTPPLAFLAIAVAIAAVAIAVTNREASMPWANTHHEHALRTLIIGYAITVLASVIVFLGEAYLIIVFYIGVAVLIWTSIRAVVGLVLAIMRKPIPRPKGWLF